PAGGFRQHRPVEIAFIRDGQNTVPERHRFKHIIRSRLPLERRDRARNDVDQNGMFYAGVADSELSLNARKNVARLAVCPQPVSYDRLALGRPETIAEKWIPWLSRHLR